MGSKMRIELREAGVEKQTEKKKRAQVQNTQGLKSKRRR